MVILLGLKPLIIFYRKKQAEKNIRFYASFYRFNGWPLFFHIKEFFLFYEGYSNNGNQFVMS
ncbi:hypothetical protein HMPREF3291_07545 [Bacillus sp. HMSC76G11]|nr:hypothetical protein HMPREF3291_07545 [Bacillus sp. HMSC76G11]